MSQEDNDSVSKIDAAIAKAQARKDAKNGTAPKTTATGELTKVEGTPAQKPVKVAKPKVSDEEKAAKQAQKDAERAKKKAERDAAREVKRLEKEKNKATPHMSKVDKAAEKLMKLSSEATLAFNELTANFGRDMLSGIADHLIHFNRVKATERALSQKVSVGDQVRIVSGGTRFTGATGIVEKSQRIRCYVTVEGAKKPVYLFTSDVELVKAGAEKKTA